MRPTPGFGRLPIRLTRARLPNVRGPGKGSRRGRGGPDNSGQARNTAQVDGQVVGAVTFTARAGLVVIVAVDGGTPAVGRGTGAMRLVPVEDVQPAGPRPDDRAVG